MEKLELKHVIPYLDEKLKIMDNTDKVFILMGVSYFNKKLFLSNDKNIYPKAKSLIHCQPILWPLKYLLLERPFENILIHPMKFIFGNNWDEWDGESESNPRSIQILYKIAKGLINPKFIDKWIFDELLKLHFDVYGLIDKGLAIDINTLKI